MAIVAYNIFGLDTNPLQTINGDYSFPVMGYFLLMKSRGGTVTVGGVSMTQLGHLGGDNDSYLFGLKVAAGTQNVTCSVNPYSIHGNVFSATKGYRQLLTGTTKTPGSITPQRGDGLCQFVYATRNSYNAATTHYTPPTGFTEMSDSGAIGSGSDWWHGGGSSYKINVGTSAVSMTWNTTGDALLHSYSLELDMVGGGGSVIWWCKNLLEKAWRTRWFPLTQERIYQIR